MMPVLKPGFAARLALILCAVASNSSAQDTLQVAGDSSHYQFLANAEDFLATGRSDAAYSLLSAREAELAGNPYFDYLLGVAALDSGRLSEAIFSLRRALAVAPDYSGARMELARAYFDSGNTALARPLFLRLLGENPPPGVRAVIDDYIASIDATPSAPGSSFRYFFDVAAGYDSNANASTDNQQFLGFVLSPDNLETDSSFVNAGAGINWNKPRNTQFGWYASGQLNFRQNPDADFVDSSVVSGSGGMNWQRGLFFGRAGIDGFWATRDGDPNQSYAGLNVLLGQRIGDRWELSLGIRSGALRHDNSIEVLDVNRSLYTGRLAYRFSASGSFGFEVIGGNDSERTAGSPYGNSKIGARLTLYTPISNSATLSASAGSLTSDYDGLFFGAGRKDTQVSTLLRIEFSDVWTDGVSLTPQIRYINNDSGVALYDYDRTEVGLLLRWTPQ